NFGQAMAHACRAARRPLVVFAATTANPMKVARMRALGADVRLEGANFDGAKAAAKRHCDATGARILATFIGFAVVAANTTSGRRAARQACAIAWPKFPAVAQTSSPSAAPATNQCAPRPLKLRIGLSASTLSWSRAPSTCDNGSHSYCGDPRKTGSIAAAASRMRPSEILVTPPRPRATSGCG
ncbi:MAG: pyridoxal-phosphate dependent enzyme, partial [Actinobacteria bacterium]|nr:pyridoxal-phosphate dependent enzyme [Actinomycetota bacterium]